MPGENETGAKPNSETPGSESGILSGETTTEENKGGNTPGQSETGEDYSKLKLPEGASVDEKFFGSVKTWAKESGIKAELLQKLVDSWGSRFKEVAAEQEAKAKEDRIKLVDGWKTELQSDKNFGGEKFKENVGLVRSFLQKTDPDKSFRQALVGAGIDNWPPLVRFLHGLAAASKDDSVMGTLEGAKPTAATSEAAFHDEMYPTMK